MQWPSGIPTPAAARGIPALLLHSGPRPSRVSQTPRCCHLGRQGTRAACVMGVGNKDAQDPEPRPPGTSRPNLHGSFLWNLNARLSTFPGTALNPSRRFYKVEHASAPAGQKNQCLGFGGESALPAQLRAYTPTPSPKQTRTSYSQPAAERRSLTPATCQPDRSETCWFASSTLLHSQLPKTKAVPRGRICGPLQEKRTQVGATRMRIATQSGGTGCRGLRASYGKSSASLCGTYDSQGPAAPTQPPPIRCPPRLAAFPTLRFSSLYPWGPRTRGT